MVAAISDVGHTICRTLAAAAAVVDDGLEQSGIAFGYRAPTRHTAITSMLSSTAPVIRTFRKLRTRAYCSSAASYETCMASRSEDRLSAVSPVEQPA